MKHLALIILAALFVAAPAEAQFGSLKNRIKREAQKAVRESNNAKQEQSTESDAKQEQSTKRLSPTERHHLQQQAKQKADAEAAQAQATAKAAASKQQAIDAAKAQDPMMANTTIEPGFTKTIGQIREAYATLDPEAFYIRPYYDNPAAYYLNTPDDRAIFEGMFQSVLSLSYQSNFDMPAYHQYFKVTVDGKKGYLPATALLQSAYFALFIADPKSDAAFDAFTKAYFISNNQYYYPDGMVSADIIDLDKDMNLPVPYDDMNSYADNMQAAALKAMNEAYTIEELCAKVNTMLTAVDKAAKAGELAKASHLAMVARSMKAAMEEHDDYSGSNASCKKTNYLVDTYLKNEGDWYQAARKSTLPSVETPQRSHKMDAATTAAAIRTAKNDYGSRFVELIFMDSKWSLFKDPDWPHHIIFRSVPVAIIYKEGSEYYMSEYNFRQYGKEGAWTQRFEFGATMKSNATQRKLNYTK